MINRRPPTTRERLLTVIGNRATVAFTVARADDFERVHHTHPRRGASDRRGVPIASARQNGGVTRGGGG
jgi:hypothetical protein